MGLPILARKVKKLASFQLLNLKMLINGEPSARGFSKFKKAYKLRGEIGRGGFGVVYRATRVSDDTPLAVKFVDRRAIKEWGRLNDEEVPMEICMLAKCAKIPGVIKLLDWYSIPEGFLIVMERPSPCMDMFDLIKAHHRLDEDVAGFLMLQIVETIQACAEKRVLHRDIKDENVVIDLVTGETKLIDFGAATILKKSHYTDFQGTRLYCPPEWFLHSLYLGKEAAVWSLGVLLYNALNGRLPFRNEKDICTAHLLGPLPFYAPVSAEARDLISRCLVFDPFTRCTLEDIIAHPWMRKERPEWQALTTQLSSSHQLDARGHGEGERATGSEELEELEHSSDGREDAARRQIAHEDDRESGVGSSRSIDDGREELQAPLAAGAAAASGAAPRSGRVAKTSLLVPPSSTELKEVVAPAKKKTMSTQHSGAAVSALARRSRRHGALAVAKASAVAGAGAKTAAAAGAEQQPAVVLHALHSAMQRQQRAAKPPAGIKA